MGLSPVICGQLFVSLFFAILFLQSGLDKVTDQKGNLEWLTGHFAKSPLKGMVPMMLGTMTLVELAAGVVNVGGVVGALYQPLAYVGVLGIAWACLALVMLFFGQRVAKDYAGAATLASYFSVALLGFVVWTAAQPR